MNLKKIVPEIITLGIILVGSLCYPLISYGLQDAPPLFFAALRTFIAGISIFLLLPLFGQPRIPPRDMWKWALLLSIPAVAFTYGTMFLSHENSTMALLPILENLQPFLSIFFAVIFLHERVSPAARIVLLFGTFGLLFFSFQSFTEGVGFDFRNAILAVLASLGASGASILVKWLGRRDIAVTLSAWQVIIGSIPLFVLSLLFEKNAPIHWTVSFVSILFFLALVGTAATTVVWYKLIQTFDVSRLSVLFFLSPALALIVANRLYAVPVSDMEWIGVIIVAGGVAVGLKIQSTAPTASPGTHGKQNLD